MTENNNLRVFDLKRNSINGVSVQYFICKKNSKPLANFEDGRKSLILAESAKRSLKSKKFEKIIF